MKVKRKLTNEAKIARCRERYLMVERYQYVFCEKDEETGEITIYQLSTSYRLDSLKPKDFRRHFEIIDNSVAAPWLKLLLSKFKLNSHFDDVED